MMQRQPLVIANWKMNGDRKLVTTMAEALREHAADYPAVQVVVCPPAVLLEAWQQAAFYDQIYLGAQDVNEHSHGAHTGEHSCLLLAEAGIAAKVSQVLAQDNMTAVLCVGESAEQRQQQQTFAVVAAQLAAALDQVARCEQLVIAYEPIWAIGTGATASPEQAQEVHAMIRQWLTEKFGSAGREVRILYGGSVKADNAAALFAQTDIDGGLIGGASLAADQFVAICTAAQTRSS